MDALTVESGSVSQAEGREGSRGSSLTSCFTVTSFFTLFFWKMGVGVSAAAAGLGLGGSA